MNLEDFRSWSSAWRTANSHPYCTYPEVDITVRGAMAFGDDGGDYVVVQG